MYRTYPLPLCWHRLELRRIARLSDLPPPGTVDPSSSFSNDIAARLRALSPQSASKPAKTGTPLDVPELQNETNDKTVEELLAELGPEERWTVGANEEQEITTLLKEAKNILPKDDEDFTPDNGADGGDQGQGHRLPKVDVSVFAPEPESPQEEENTNTSTHAPHRSEDQEADELLQRILDEVAHEPPEPDPEPETESQQAATEPSLKSPPQADLPPPPSYTSHNFPASPSTQPSPPVVDDSDLASRFASLNLPSVPTALPQGPATIKTPSKKQAKEEEEEEDQYCVICFADPAVRCLGHGCDGDLYCNLCWREGHTGEDVGREMRSHKALVLNRGEGKEEGHKGKSKVVLRRPKGRLVGA